MKQVIEIDWKESLTEVPPENVEVWVVRKDGSIMTCTWWAGGDSPGPDDPGGWCDDCGIVARRSENLLWAHIPKGPTRD